MLPYVRKYNKVKEKAVEPEKKENSAGTNYKVSEPQPVPKPQEEPKKPYVSTRNMLSDIKPEEVKAPVPVEVKSKAEVFEVHYENQGQQEKQARNEAKADAEEMVLEEMVEHRAEDNVVKEEVILKDSPQDQI